MKRRLRHYLEMIAWQIAMLSMIGLHGKPILDSFANWRVWTRVQQLDFVVRTVAYASAWVVVYVRFKRCEKRLVERRWKPSAAAQILRRYKRYKDVDTVLRAWPIQHSRRGTPSPTFCTAFAGSEQARH